MTSMRSSVGSMFAENAPSRLNVLYRLVEIVIVVSGIVCMMLATTDELEEHGRQVALAIVAAGLGFNILDWLARLWTAPLAAPLMPPARARARWMGSRASVIGLITIVPMAVLAPFDWSPEGAPLFAALWIIRFAHYSRGMSMLLDVLARESDAVLGVLLAFGSLLLFTAVTGFLFEHRIQPESFGSVPRALWWAITTLTTTGYGDMIPQTLLGRILAGLMMIAGIVVFGLLAGILGTGFSQEIRRQEFLRNWDLIKHVPMFHDIGPGTIADLAALLRPKELPPRAVIWRYGDRGDCMYFIVSGEVEILIDPPLRLGGGAFFGEMALLNDRPRNATVVTTLPCRLLGLDIADFRALASRTPALLRSIEQEARRRSNREKADNA